MRNLFSRQLIIALFLIGQCFALAHAAEFGDGVHSHDGVLCFVSVSENDTDAIVQSGGSNVDLSRDSENTWALPLTTFARPLPLSIWPPPTGPPSNH